MTYGEVAQLADDQLVPFGFTPIGNPGFNNYCFDGIVLKYKIKDTIFILTFSALETMQNSEDSMRHVIRLRCNDVILMYEKNIK